MTKELIINATGESVEIALLEDKKLSELHYEHAQEHFAVGDLYLGRIKKLMPGLNAAFVDVGYEKDAFLHYTDLSPYFRSLVKFTQQAITGKPEWGEDFGKFKNEPEIVKTGKITEVISGKADVLVQILKEPISSKGPRLSCEVSLPGRFVVLTPFNDFVSISRKIHSAEERKRLQRIVEAIKPKNFGVIVRTAAEGKNTAELHTDMMELAGMWAAIQKNLVDAKPSQVILSERNKTTSILRDLLSESFQRIVVNDKKIFDETRDYISRIAPEKADIVTLHNHAMNIFDQFGVTKQMKASFGKTVNLESGSYLIIEHTEAMHVIDVNSGTRSGDMNQEQNALQTNLEAAKEISRQMRLRDLGGIIIIDFIDMRLPDNRKVLVERMAEFMTADRAKHTILPVSKFGLVQITRQRLRPEVQITTTEVCPSCKGTGKIGPTILLTDDIEKDLKYLVTQGHRALTLHVNPILAAYLTKSKGLFFTSSQIARWKKALDIKLKLVEDGGMALTTYQFYDTKTDDLIKL